MRYTYLVICLSMFLTIPLTVSTAQADVGVSAPAPADAEILLDGSREMLDQKWTYWKGPRFGSSLPIK